MKNPAFDIDMDEHHEEEYLLDRRKTSDTQSSRNVLNGVGSGNAIYASVRAAISTLTGRLKVSKSIVRNTIFPIAIWIAVSFISTIAQIGIHSTIANQRVTGEVEMPFLNLWKVVQYPPNYKNFFDNVIFPGNQELATSLLSGQQGNISRSSFAIDGNVCGGQDIPRSFFETYCFVSQTICQHADFQFRSGIDSPNNIEYITTPLPFTFSPDKVLPGTALQITDSDPFGDDTNGLNMSFEYEGLIPIEGIQNWAVLLNGTISPPPVPGKTYTSPYRLTRGTVSTTYWRGNCKLKVAYCPATVEDGKVNVSHTNCKGLRGDAYGDNELENGMGIGAPWRTETTFVNVATRIARTRPELMELDPSGQTFIQTVISEMAFAWVAAGFDVGGVQADGNEETKIISVYKMDPRDAIAVDAILLLILLILLGLSITFFVLGYGVNKLLRDRVTWLNKVKWDPIYKYALIVDEKEGSKKFSKMESIEGAAVGAGHGGSGAGGSGAIGSGILATGMGLGAMGSREGINEREGSILRFPKPLGGSKLSLVVPEDEGSAGSAGSKALLGSGGTIPTSSGTKKSKGFPPMMPKRLGEIRSGSLVKVTESAGRIDPERQKSMCDS
ncbi:hypothetical protein HDU97_001667 [Phlyctochytrium planicorne]|nr:hypothetical protein HDU97_001667 [Phlyctochytrium planicorne]